MAESNGQGTSPVDNSPPTQEQAPIDLELPASVASFSTEADNQKEIMDETKTIIMQDNVNEMARRTDDILVGLSNVDGSAPDPSTTSAAPLINGSISAVDIQVDNNHGTPGEKRPDMETFEKSSDELNQHQVKIESENCMSQEPNYRSEDVKLISLSRGLVDTTAPFESVREAVSKYGGIVDWKAHKAMTIEKRKRIEIELQQAQEEISEYKKQSEAAEDAKVQVLRELENTKRHNEELKLNLDKAETEEAQAKQDSELARLRVEEMEQGITDEVSVAAKAQFDLAKARYATAVADLETVKCELEAMQADYVSLAKEKEIAVLRAKEAVSASEEIESTVEELTLELITVKESLESAHAAHMEAEEHRIGVLLVRDEDTLNYEKELKQAEEDSLRLNEQLLSAKGIKSKLDTASKLLLDLKAELAAYMDAKMKEEIDNKEELEEVELKIERAKEEVKRLEIASASLQPQLEREKADLATMRQMEAMVSVAVSSLEAELSRTKEEIELARVREREAKEKMVELPKELEKAVLEADKAKLEARTMHEELRKARDEAEQAKAAETTFESRLKAALKETEAAKASERLALAAVKAMQESEENILDGVTLPLNEYFELSKQAHEAEKLADQRVVAAIAQVEVAKQSELISLERLEEVNKELMERREALKLALEKAEVAKKGKLGMEQELRKWRSDQEHLRRKAEGVQCRSPAKTFDEGIGRKSVDNDLASAVHVLRASSPKLYHSHEETITRVLDGKTKKKRWFFPKIVMFLAGRRGSGGQQRL
ncbi:Protein WEAK CHLOROPLAST MOVEMENT UNDER BLUE LIGHT-like 3 [Acorus gramineus]|uniref:Protein WEAK CHLOROPLAST MOVEMENT UNDER BLUE LIGHT-like 3 n=1 Tax=Acorus gramineus TaxID=55184 RepID=A0AAV8ZWA7_ACOGR|nr:Protein WEAK CHLOROPLAST MOVEMENT UNDER BLUE LIGHT-like 3 [Acorus gramineus]